MEFRNFKFEFIEPSPHLSRESRPPFTSAKLMTSRDLLATISLVIISLVMTQSSLLKSYLQSSRQLLLRAAAGADPMKLSLCLGNESADADSIISSLCLGFLRHRGDSRPTIPLVAVRKKDLPLRRETQLLLQRVRLDLSDLICIDEVDVLSLYRSGHVQDLVLVDHNSISSGVAETYFKMVPTEGLVSEIIDHHKDCGAHAHLNGEKRTVAFDNALSVATVGSTCTLIAERFLSSSTNREESADIATLLLGAILLDTLNMDAQAARGSARDSAAIDSLGEVSKESRDELFATLRDAKSNAAFWSELSSEDCLRLDYKMFVETRELFKVGISSVLLPIVDMAAKADFTETISGYLNEKDLDLMVVMTFTAQPTPHREILFASRNAGRLSSLEAFLQEQGQLQLQPLQLPRSAETVAGNRMLCYVQGNVKASRKQIQPTLSSFYEAAI